MDETERQRLMGDRLVAMRDYLVSFVERNYNLEMFHGAAPLNSVIADVFGS